MRIIWVVGLVLLATALFLLLSCSNREPEKIAEISVSEGHNNAASIKVDENHASAQASNIVIISIPEISTTEDKIFYTPSAKQEQLTEQIKEYERFSFCVSASYGFMYVTADGARNTPSDWGYNIGINGLYRVNSLFSVGIGVYFGQYFYDSSGYHGAYTVIDPVLIAEVGIPFSENTTLSIGLNAGYNIRLYKEQKGIYPTVMANMEVRHRLSDRLSVGIGATAGMAFQNCQLPIT